MLLRGDAEEYDNAGARRYNSAADIKEGMLLLEKK
jgi:hypothetical protein